MKIVIAPDSFKENLTSLEVANEIEAGLKRVWPDAQCIKVPMADGGEGTVQSLVDATGGEIVKCEVLGPLGAKRARPSYGLLGDGRTAVIEMAEASGLPLVPQARAQSARGFHVRYWPAHRRCCAPRRRGDHHWARRLGNQRCRRRPRTSAWACASSMPRAHPSSSRLAAAGSEEITAIDTRWVNPYLHGVRMSVACDVTNPLVGEKGASRVYGPQKGATPEMVEHLDKSLAHFASIIKRDLGIDIAETQGAGAGGGLGGGLIAFTNATLKRGVELVVAATRLEDYMHGADLAITGEGRVDFQTAFGKTPSGVAAAARKFGVPVVAIGGGLSDDAGGVFAHGIDGLETATPNAMALDVAIKKSRQYLQDAAERVARLIAIGQRAAGTKSSTSDEKPKRRKVNKPAKAAPRAKKLRGLTHAALTLSARRRKSK